MHSFSPILTDVRPKQDLPHQSSLSKFYCRSTKKSFPFCSCLFWPSKFCILFSGISDHCLTDCVTTRQNFNQSEQTDAVDLFRSLCLEGARQQMLLTVGFYNVICFFRDIPWAENIPHITRQSEQNLRFLMMLARSNDPSLDCRFGRSSV